jgi:2-iminobutanoate/2-iminopropanoate deaminase
MKPGGALVRTVEEQTRLALENVSHILKAAGSSMDNVLKITILLGDMGDFAAVNGVYAEFFSEPYPARAAFQAAALPLNAMVEIEAVAIMKES